MRSLVVLSLGLLSLRSASAGVAAIVQDESRAPFRLKWISDLGAESLTVRGRSANVGVAFAGVPGAVYAFSTSGESPLLKLNRIPADSAIAYSFAVARNEVVVADDEGSVSLWSGFGESEPGKLKWQRRLGERVMSLSWDGGRKVWVGSRENRVLALSASDGSVLWSTRVEGKVEAPAVSNGRSVFAATKSNRLLRLDAATGAVRFEKTLPGPVIHPPLLLGEARKLVLCATRNGHLHVYDGDSGVLRWSIALPERLAGAPVAGADLIAAVTADGTARGFDLDGKEKWKATEAAKGAADLHVYAGDKAAPTLLVASNILTAFDGSTGARLDDYPLGALEDLKRRSLEAVMEGGRSVSEREKEALRENEAFAISGTLFGEIQASAHGITFGTEEGWIYFFDPTSLRPIARYRAGLKVSGAPRVAAGTLVAVGSGNEIFGLDPSTGEARWRRSLGAAVEDVAGGSSLVVIAAGRLSALSPTTGVRQWTAPLVFRSLGPPHPDPNAGPLVAADEKGYLHALDASGRSLGPPLATGTDTPRLVPLGSSAWGAVRPTGSVVGVTWSAPLEIGAGGDEGRLAKAWEVDLRAPIVDVQSAGSRLFLLSEAGYVAGFEEGKELWRQSLAESRSYRLAASEGGVIAFGKNDLRFYDVGSGKLIFSRAVSASVIGATVEDGALVWLESSGKGHRVSLEGGTEPESVDLGQPLHHAWPSPGGFMVTTAAGELAFVERTEGGK